MRVIVVSEMTLGETLAALREGVTHPRFNEAVRFAISVLAALAEE
jgi:hypothetical protein